MKSRVLIIDDELPARKLLRRLLADHADIEIVAEAASIAEARALIGETTPDLVLLDVRMPRGNGFELLQNLSNPPKVIFVTAHESHAIDAFHVAAVDYLMKPVSSARLAISLDRFRGFQNAVKSAQETITLEVNGVLKSVPGNQIVYFRAQGNYTEVRLRSNESLLVYKGITDFENQLAGEGFIRADRSHLVNSHLISQLNPLDRDSSVLTFVAPGVSLDLGRTASARIKEFLRVLRNAGSSTVGE